MRKIFFLSFFSLILATASMAQDKIGIAPELGLNLSKMVFSDAPAITNYIKPGFKVGVNFDWILDNSYSLQAGLFLLQAGSDMDVNVVFVGPVMVPLSVYYAKLPINVLYRYGLGNGSLVFSGGPYVSYALGISANPSDTAFKTTNINIGTDSSSLIKPLDIGLDIAIAYQLKNGVFAKLSYSYGITDISSQSGASIHNSIIGISVGWLYRSTKSKGTIKAKN